MDVVLRKVAVLLLICPVPWTIIDWLLLTALPKLNRNMPLVWRLEMALPHLQGGQPAITSSPSKEETLMAVIASGVVWSGDAVRAGT
jgi:hypothetical protein